MKDLLRFLMLPILTVDELYESMPIIHSAIATQYDDPHIPILTERNLEVELKILQHEHNMENGTLENFPGLTKQAINLTILASNENRIIADIDGRGHIDNPLPLQIKETSNVKISNDPNASTPQHTHARHEHSDLHN